MAVGLRLKFAGGTQENYEAVHAAMDIEANPPDGLIVHSAGPLEDGWGVIDFWESRAQFDAFVQGRLVPGLQRIGDQGFAGPPDIKEFPVHNLEVL